MHNFFDQPWQVVVDKYSVYELEHAITNYERFSFKESVWLDNILSRWSFIAINRKEKYFTKDIIALIYLCCKKCAITFVHKWYGYKEILKHNLNCLEGNFNG